MTGVYNHDLVVKVWYGIILLLENLFHRPRMKTYLQNSTFNKSFAFYLRQTLMPQLHCHIPSKGIIRLEYSIKQCATSKAFSSIKIFMFIFDTPSTQIVQKYDECNTQNHQANVSCCSLSSLLSMSWFIGTSNM